MRKLLAKLTSIYSLKFLEKHKSDRKYTNIFKDTLMIKKYTKCRCPVSMTLIRKKKVTFSLKVPKKILLYFVFYNKFHGSRLTDYF